MELKSKKAAGTKNTCLDKAKLIYEYTHVSASSLLKACHDAKTARGNPRGVLTDQEQDILRAALVMCCSGLDAILKQAIRDSITLLMEKNQEVLEGFEKFVRKRISGDTDALEFATGARFLTTVLISGDPKKKLIEEYIKELTGDSLQSAEEVFRTSAALGIDPKRLKLPFQDLKDVFIIRNLIIHELDIDLDAPKRKRRVRGQDDLIRHCDLILDTGRDLLQELEKQL